MHYLQNSLGIAKDLNANLAFLFKSDVQYVQ